MIEFIYVLIGLMILGVSYFLIRKARGAGVLLASGYVISLIPYHLVHSWLSFIFVKFAFLQTSVPLHIWFEMGVSLKIVLALALSLWGCVLLQKPVLSKK